MSIKRKNSRVIDELRPIEFEKNYNPYAEGSCLVSMGNTKVICTATVENGVPQFLRGTGEGWLTAEYGMLPRSTHSRNKRESSSNKPNGRSLEIQRLIGRSLRACLDMKKLGDNTIRIDCDVIQADGGTRTASINGGYVALYYAIKLMESKKMLKAPFEKVMKEHIAAISLGIKSKEVLLDLDYEEDSNIDADFNLVMNSKSEIIEIQGTSEQQPVSIELINNIVTTGQKAIKDIITQQRKVFLYKYNLSS